jgi:broad specificity phosphatase PhoE
MPMIVIFRHGQRRINTGCISGDGPLTTKGKFHTRTSTRELVADLRAMNISQIDLAIVSGSIRGSQTYAEIWDVLLEKGMPVRDYDMHRDYFSTREEDVGWKSLYDKHNSELQAAIHRDGERVAVMKFAGNLVHRCVSRIISRIDQAVAEGAKNILLVTHGPHDALIYEHYDSETDRDDCLKMGTYDILEYELKEKTA